MKEVTGVVYSLLSPSGKEYIGRTVDLKRRLRRYATEKQQSTPIYLEIRKYGFENFKVDVLFECHGERVKVEKELNEQEEFFISTKIPENLLNVYRWDSNIRRFELSDKTKQKMRESHTGKKHSFESRLKRAKENAYQARRVRSDKLCRTFSTLKEAATYVGVSGGCKISECINGKRKSVGKHPVTKEPIDDWKFVQ